MGCINRVTLVILDAIMLLYAEKRFKKLYN
jgi:hypothetical protein